MQQETTKDIDDEGLLITKDTDHQGYWLQVPAVLRGLKHLMAGPGVKHGRRVTLSVPMA